MMEGTTLRDLATKVLEQDNLHWLKMLLVQRCMVMRTI